MTEVVEPTSVLAEVASSLDLGSVDGAARDHAIDLLLDALVCALAADHAEDTTAFRAVADAIGGSGTTTVLGEAERRTLASAVLLNGFRITAVTACDVYTPAELHSTPAVVPPVLAIAERDGRSGADVLRAVVVGLETAVRLTAAFDRTTYRARGWHSPGVIAPLGAAAACAAILGLDATRTRDAIAIGASQAAGTWVQRGTPTVKFHQARAAHAGLMGGLLAAEGFSASANVIVGAEGGMHVAYAPGDPTAALDGLGETWRLGQISIRLGPGSARLQPSIAAASELSGGASVPWAAIERVEVRVAPAIADAQAWAAAPRSTFEALASIPFAVAVTLRDGSAAPAAYTASGYGDPTLQAWLAERVTVVGDDAIDAQAATIEVRTTDGAHHTASVAVPPGHPERPATRDELAHKAHRFGDDRIGSAAVDELVRRVRGITDEPDLSAILALVRGTG